METNVKILFCHDFTSLHFLHIKNTCKHLFVLASKKIVLLIMHFFIRNEVFLQNGKKYYHCAIFDLITSSSNFLQILNIHDRKH